MDAQPFSRVHCDLMDHQDPLSMQFSRQEYWSRFPFPTPGNLPDPGIKSASHESSANACDAGSIHESGRSSGEGAREGAPLQYSCLGNPMDRGAWRTIVHGVTKSWT